MSSTNCIFRLGEKIGSGAFSYVFQARETTTGHVVALKKSRVSLKVRRTLHHHEACILQLIAGHPSIPTVFAYGRFEHFEYLAMELLERSLGDVVEKQGKLPLKTVLHVADQMLSVLEHIHGLRIVHRDIKPNNIMVNIMMHRDDLSVVHLIDFGIARPCLMGDPNVHDLIKERLHVVGTLTWASLNAHKGIDLGPRDDLESLAYTLLFLLRGELPWQAHCEHGTVLGRMAQIREKKCAWPGYRLGEGHPPIFGELLEYARGLRFNEPIDYGRFRSQVERLQQVSDLIESDKTDLGDQLKQSLNEISEAYECPVEVGQFVYVQVVSRTSIEGYSIQADDPSFWHDPALSSSEWHTSARPAIVIDTRFDRSSSLHTILVVSLGNGAPSPGTKIVSVSAPHLAPTQGETVIPEPTWPIPQTYCYAFPRATKFFCLPGQARAPAHWKIGTESVQLLEKAFGVAPSAYYWMEANDDPNPDVRHDARMKMRALKFFAKVTPLEPATIDSTHADSSIDWRGDRAWFDERVKIARRRGWEDGVDWTGIEVTFSEEEKRSVVKNSYYESDHSLWEGRQQERNHSLTLDSYHQELNRQIYAKGELGNIVQVV